MFMLLIRKVGTYKTVTHILTATHILTVTHPVTVTHLLTVTHPLPLRAPLPLRTPLCCYDTTSLPYSPLYLVVLNMVFEKKDTRQCISDSHRVG